MTNSKPQEAIHNQDRALAPLDKAAIDSAMAGQKLLDDIQGKFYGGSAKPEALDKLVKSGVLPEGATFIDFGAVKTRLDVDHEKLKKLESFAPGDVDGAAKLVTDSRTAPKVASDKFDAAAAKADPLQARIDGRIKQDEQVKKDFATLCGALKTDILDKADVASLAFDLNKSQAVRDAAKNLMGTFYDTTRPAGGRGRSTTPVHYTANDYTDSRTWSGKPYFDQESIERGIKKHETLNAADRKLLVPLARAKNQAELGKAAADDDVANKQKHFKDINNYNEKLETEKTKLAEQIKEEQKILTPTADVEKLGRVIKGGGYYQVAENILGLKTNNHTDMEEKQLKILTKLLKEEAQELHGGQLPKYLVKDDQLLKPENIHRVLEKLKRSLPPSPSAEKKAAVVPKKEEKDIVFE